MKKILFVTKSQYGYHIDPYKFGCYLKNDFQITHISWDFGLPKIKTNGINTLYISRKGYKLIRLKRFLIQLSKEIKTQKYDLVFLVYFPGCSYLLWNNSKVIFNIDIRTATDTKSNFTNFWKDAILKWECSQFKHLSILSYGLAKKLAFKKFHYLPLGGEKFCYKYKTFDQLNMLYVGTLENRDLLTFVKGLHRFIRSTNKVSPTISFTIIGDGPGNERQEIEDYIKENHLNETIRTLGYIHNDQLNAYFEKANIGVSYIPITPYYTHQPPTKTYEYLLSGLPVLATATNENIKIIDESCGILIQDHEEDIAQGINRLTRQLKHYESEKIMQICLNQSWVNISRNNLRPYLESIITKREYQSKLTSRYI
ncbi:glycosyltransferase [uncultured Cyclobacterium sp.]|uniref:glycosyltransferase n=1 Tax=uncultured Cyclobacterium sp. TaxID=453820 RepID=UPI0030EB3A04|tara:strand:+ start:135019 stop:136125 length:1107 start_codon:yes stop_codon:yes gene_type:complete